MARGDHPQRTPFYGVCLLLVVIYVLAAIAAVVGFAMTFRDSSF
jgi:hypothetical protein